MPEQIITVDINEDGTFDLDMAGFKGKGCKDIAKKFAAAGKAVKETIKPEYYDAPGAKGTVSAGR